MTRQTVVSRGASVVTLLVLDGLWFAVLFGWVGWLVFSA